MAKASKKKPSSFRLPLGLAERLVVFAAAHRMNFSEVARMAMNRGLTAMEREHQASELPSAAPHIPRPPDVAGGGVVATARRRVLSRGVG